jgi:chromate reductase
MNEPLTILGMAGSLRKESYNRAALRAAQQLVPAGARLEVYELDANLPGFNEEQERQPPQSVVELKNRIRAADAILISTPEYNYSIPGVLKNTIDWASRPYGESAWTGKPVAIMGASIGKIGTARAQYHLRQCFVFLNMPAVLQPEVMIGPAPEFFDAQGNLKNDDARKLISQLLEGLVDLARLHGQAATNRPGPREPARAPHQQESRTH